MLVFYELNGIHRGRARVANVVGLQRVAQLPAGNSQGQNRLPERGAIV